MKHMKRLLALLLVLAIGLGLGAPALAEDLPATDTPEEPPAAEEPASSEHNWSALYKEGFYLPDLLLEFLGNSLGVNFHSLWAIPFLLVFILLNFLWTLIWAIIGLPVSLVWSLFY